MISHTGPFLIAAWGLCAPAADALHQAAGLLQIRAVPGVRRLRPGTGRGTAGGRSAPLPLPGLLAAALSGLTAEDTVIFLVSGGGSALFERPLVPAEDLARLTQELLSCGADKVSVNSGAIQTPELIDQAAKRYGDQCVVLSVDVKRVDGQFHVFRGGGRVDTGLDALEWIRQGVDRGAGEVVVNSIDTDGVKGGFDLELLQAVCRLVRVPVIASGGAGGIGDFVDLFRSVPDVSAGLAASIFHYGEIPIPVLKRELRKMNINVRL